MRKFFILLGILFFSTSPVNARDFGHPYQSPRFTFANNTAVSHKIRPYIGIDYAYTHVNFKAYGDIYMATNHSIFSKNSIENNYTSYMPVLGIKLGSYIGLEAFYQMADDQHKRNFTTTFNAFGLDLQGYIPFEEQLELILSFGFASYSLELENSSPSIYRTFYEKASEDVFGTRLGLGLQYNITNHLALRAMGRYIMLNSNNIHDVAELSLGLRYMFN